MRAVIVPLLLCACAPPTQDLTCVEASTAMALWRGGCLRGANVYQADLSRDDVGGDFGPAFVDQDVVDLASHGANLVNYSVPGPRHVRDASPWPEALNHLVALVDAAEAADLFVVLALRTGPGRSEGDIIGLGFDDHTVWTDAGAQDGWVTMWQELAEAVVDRPHVVGLDLMVEPHDVDIDTWLGLASRIVDGIRQVDAELPVLVGPVDWSGIDSLVDWAPLDDDHLVTTVHQYEPFAYTHEDRDTFSAGELDDVERKLDDWRRRTDGVLAVNEFGVTTDKPNAGRFLRESLDRLDGLGLSHAAWLWEVAAPDGYRRFDFKQDPEQLAAFEASWSANVVRPSTW